MEVTKALAVTKDLVEMQAVEMPEEALEIY
jgi:hypothetical protein